LRRVAICTPTLRGKDGDKSQCVRWEGPDLRAIPVGFRYVKVTGYEGEIKPDDFVAVAIYSDLEETGDFSCSNPLVNRLVKNSRWSQKGNYLDVPTDWPTRERSPWTGDSQVYCRTAVDFMDVYPFFEKWMQDYNLGQMKSGKFHSLVPSGMRNEAEKKRVKEEFFKSLEGKEELSMTDQMMLQMYADESDESSVGDGSAGWSGATYEDGYIKWEAGSGVWKVMVATRP
jgi:alpha-L-rhamnosidase